MTDYIATRWYRAPEIVLGSQSYHYPSDVWTFGCVLVEIFIGQPLFPGSSSLNQLQRILQVTGVPTKADFTSLNSPISYAMMTELYISELNRDLTHVMSPYTMNQQVVDLAKKCLSFIPEHRPDFETILDHPFFKEHHDIKKEFTTNKKITDSTRYGTMMALRKAIYELCKEMNEEREMHYENLNQNERYGNYM